MNHFYGAFELVLLLLKWVAASGVVYAVSRLGTSRPESAVVRFVRHRHRTWIALGLFFVPMIAGRLYFSWMFQRQIASSSNIDFNLSLTTVLNLFDGVILGTVACLLASPDNDGQQFRHWFAFGIATGLVLLFAAMERLGWMSGLRRLPVGEIFATLVFGTLLLARAFPHPSSVAAPDGLPVKSKSPGLALGLAFLPSVMVLVVIPLLKGKPPAELFVFCCGVSVTCCFGASFLLFRRGTALAIFGGIVFLLLNAVVSFLFGCGAVLTGAHF